MHFQPLDFHLPAVSGCCEHSTDSSHSIYQNPCTFDCCVTFPARHAYRTCTIHQRRSHRPSAVLLVESGSRQCCSWNVPIPQISHVAHRVSVHSRDSFGCCLFCYSLPSASCADLSAAESFEAHLWVRSLAVAQRFASEFAVWPRV